MECDDIGQSELCRQMVVLDPCGTITEDVQILILSLLFQFCQGMKQVRDALVVRESKHADSRKMPAPPSTERLRLGENRLMYLAVLMARNGLHSL